MLQDAGYFVESGIEREHALDPPADTGAYLVIWKFDGEVNTRL